MSPSQLCFPWPALALSLGLSLLPSCVSAQPAAEAVPTASSPATASPLVPRVAPLAALPPDGVDVEEGRRLQGLTQVAIAGVALYVVTEAEGGASAGAALHGGMATANTSLKVTGLDPLRLQALADLARARTEAALVARGIVVMPQAQLAALPAFAELQQVADAAPLAFDAQGGKGQAYSASGLPLLHRDEMAWLSRASGTGLLGAMTGRFEDAYVSLGDKVSGGFKAGRVEPALERLGQQAGMPLVLVRLVLTAAQVQGSGSRWGFTAGTETRNTLLMPAWTNRILVRRPGGDYARVSLKKGWASEAGLGELVDVTTTGQKAVSVLTTAFTLLAAANGVGRGVSSISQSYELRSSPEVFDAVATPQVEATLASLAQALAP